MFNIFEIKSVNVVYRITSCIAISLYFILMIGYMTIHAIGIFLGNMVIKITRFSKHIKNKYCDFLLHSVPLFIRAIITFVIFVLIIYMSYFVLGVLYINLFNIPYQFTNCMNTGSYIFNVPFAIIILSILARSIYKYHRIIIDTEDKEVYDSLSELHDQYAKNQENSL